MKWFLCFAVVISLVISACGDEGTSPPTAGDPSTPPTTATTQRGELAASSGVERLDPNPSAPVVKLVAGFNDAGFDLWQSQAVDGNFVFSPMSIGHALLMARGAADDSTGAAIDSAMGLPAGVSAHDAWNRVDNLLLDDAGAEESITVTMADRIWPRLDIEPSQEWVDLLIANHGVSVQPLDYGNDTSGSRDIINSWISDQTQELIPELLPDGFLQPSTVLVLTDAVYFEAQWQKVFGKTGPIPGTFTRLDGSTIDMEFMQELELVDRRGTGDGYVAAEIPYIGSGFSMLLILPDEGRFEELRQLLHQSLIDEIDATIKEGGFELVVPKWTTTTVLDLMSWLTEIGAAPGSYPGISPDAFLGAAVHGADIAVDEVGTVAAAATAIGFLESASPQPEFAVRADRPFLYMVRHRSTGLVLFAGQVTDPTG
jgi:serpin B